MKIYQAFIFLGIMATGIASPEIGMTETRPLIVSQATARDLIKSAFSKLEQRNIQGAIADLDRAIQLEPQNPEAYLNRGAVRQMGGNMQGALSDYTQAIKLKPSYIIAYRNRAEIYFRTTKYKEAISDYSKLIELNPGDAGAYYGRGLATAATGNKNKAVQDLKKAAEIYRQQGNQADLQAAEERIRNLQQSQRN